MKNFTIILSWPPDHWIDICPACLEKKIPGTQVLSGDHSIVMDLETRKKNNIIAIRQSPCKCDYCGALGEKEDWHEQR